LPFVAYGLLLISIVNAENTCRQAIEAKRHQWAFFLHLFINEWVEKTL